MSDAPVLCRRCGVENATGDQFCGSCGAFLEWEGALPGDEPSASPVPGAAPESVVSCPTCRIANAATRTFCQSCGTRLAGATQVGLEAARSTPVAGGAAMSPAPLPSSPVAGGATKGLGKPAVERSGGVPGWLFAVVGLGLVVGIVSVVLATLLGAPLDVPSGVATGSVASPVAPPASAGPGSPVPASPAPSADPTPTVTPVAGTPLEFVGATASSVVGGRAKFSATTAIDGDPRTSWQEGATEEAGQWLEIELAGPARIDALVIWNGYQESEASYFANRRLRDVRISFDTGRSFEFRLEDTMEPITVEVSGVTGASRVRIEILTTYDPRKTEYAGSPFDDCALSEVRVIGAPVARP